MDEAEGEQRDMASSNYAGGGGNKKDDLGSWIAIIVMLMIPTPWTWLIGFIWLVRKLKGSDGKKSVKRHPYDLQREGAAQAHWEGPRQEGRSTVTVQKTSRRTGQTTVTVQRTSQRTGQPDSRVTRTESGGKAKEKDRKRAAEGSGTGLVIGGAILSAIFSMGTVSTFMEMMSFVDYAGYPYSGDVTGLLACLMFLGGGLAMLFSGLGKRRRGERYLNYLAYIGANREVDLARMAASMDVSVKKLVKDLRRMLAKGILPTGYIDLAEGKLFLTEMGYRAPEPKQAPEPERTEAVQKESEDSILREIRQVNDDIPDEVMSAKIDRIEEITGKILAYQKKNPNRAGQLRSFLNYYLPTTLKILRAYAQLDAQGIEGENISAAKARIEGMMDQVVAGFEKQLDKLFQDDALDIASDVEVLENMLKTDGLSGGEGMTLGL